MGESLPLRIANVKLALYLQVEGFFMKYYAYILKSLSHGTYYYGSSGNLAERLKVHNLGKVRYTKGRRPWQVHYAEDFESRSEAVRRERFFKTIEGYRYLKENGII